MWSVFLSSTIKVDDFTAQLFRIYVQVLEEGLAQVPRQDPRGQQLCPFVLWWDCVVSASLFAAVGFELSPGQAGHCLWYDVSVTACELRTSPCLAVTPFGLCCWQFRP